MGKIKEFSITLSPQQTVYYPSQHVAGYVTIDLKEPMKMRGIVIELYGEGYCYWLTRQNKTYIRYETNEPYVSLQQVLCGDMSQTFQAPAGEQIFQFSFVLPASLPSSFESKLGRIRYHLSARVDNDHKVDCPITVNDIIDTNNPNYLQPVAGNAHADVGFLFLKAGSVDMTASIDRKCYAPGEAILITCDVKNQTNRDMGNVQATLFQIVQFNARTQHTQQPQSKQEMKEVARVAGPGIPRGENFQWVNQPFVIPALPPTTSNSTLINISYQLKIVVSIPFSPKNCEYTFPVVLGTVPLRQTADIPPV